MGTSDQGPVASAGRLDGGGPLSVSQGQDGVTILVEQVEKILGREISLKEWQSLS